MMKLLDSNDRYWLLATVIAPLLLWWFFIGSKKYSLKGQR